MLHVWNKKTKSVFLQDRVKEVIMKTSSKLVIISLLFYLLVPLAFLLFFLSGPLWILGFIVAAPVAFYNIWRVSNRWWMVPLFGINFAASYFLFVILSTFLYNNSISPDKVTLAVGILFALIFAIIALVVTVILTVIKAIVLRTRS